MKQESKESALKAFQIESDSILATRDCMDMESFSRAVDALAAAPRIAATGCGHSGIACRHFAHSMCCINRPARFLSPAEAIHGASGFLQKGDVLVWASRGGKTDETRTQPVGTAASSAACRALVRRASPSRERSACSRAARVRVASGVRVTVMLSVDDTPYWFSGARKVMDRSLT